MCELIEGRQSRVVLIIQSLDDRNNTSLTVCQSEQIRRGGYAKNL